MKIKEKIGVGLLAFLLTTVTTSIRQGMHYRFVGFFELAMTRAAISLCKF